MIVAIDYKEIAAYKDKIEELRISLARYGAHAEDCAEEMIPRGECTCGFDDALTEKETR